MLPTNGRGAEPSRLRWPWVCGLASAALGLFWAGVIGATGAPQLSKGTDEDFAAFFAAAGNRGWLLGAWFALAVAGFLFLWFLGGLRAWLPPGEPLTAAAFMGGVVFAALLFVFAALDVVIAWTFEEARTDAFELEPQIARLVEGASNLVAIEATLAAGVLVWAASRVGGLPRWLARAGVGAAVVMVLAAVPVHGVPLVLLPVWVAAVSLVMLRGRPSSPASVPAP